MNLKCPLGRHAILIILFLLKYSVCSAQTIAELTPTIQNSVPINGMMMYYEIYGQGEPLVLLHGFTGSGKNWASIVDDFSGKYQVIVPDLRGHGQSTNPGNEFTHRQSALDVFALLDHLGIDDFKAMGISTGGMTLLHAATQQPERVSAMVLIGSTIYFPEQAREIMRSVIVESQSEESWAGMRQEHVHGDEQIKSLWNLFYNFQYNYDDMNFTAPYLSTIKARTLIVHGDRDDFFPVSIPIEMYLAIPNSALWIVPEGGHVPVFGENEAYFIQRATSFLKGSSVD